MSGSASGLTVVAAEPATRAAFVLQQFSNCPLDMIAARLRLFVGDDPADPFIAGQRRQILPPFQGRFISQERLA